MSGGGGAEAPKIPGYVNKATKPYAQELGAFNQQYDPEFYGGQMTAGMDPFTQQGAQGMGNFNTQGSQDYLQQSMQGNFLGLSPEMRSAVMDPAMDASAGRFASMGRYGSPASQQAMAQAGMQAAMPYYNQERDRQQQSAMQLPAMQQMQNQQQLMGGQINEGYAQNQINEDMSRFNFEQNKPYDIMQKWASLYGPLSQAGAVGGGVPGGSDLAGGLGGVLTGAAAGGALAGTEAGAFLGPWGMAGGAALGGLAGLLGG
jgi:hypothetical protein